MRPPLLTSSLNKNAVCILDRHLRLVVRVLHEIVRLETQLERRIVDVPKRISWIAAARMKTKCAQRRVELKTFALPKIAVLRIAMAPLDILDRPANRRHIE